MAMQYEATLRLKGDDQTAEAFRSASEAARRFADQQTRATRGLREDVDSVGRAFRGLRRTALVGGLAGVLTQAVTQAANFGDKLNRIGINARASEETMRRVGATLRQEASRLNLDIDKVVEGYDAWRVATGQSVEAALRSFPAIGEAAKAMNADVSTVGASMGSLASNLRLSGDDMRVTLDQMARAAGDIGVPFEEFSRNFGGMAEQMQRLGIQGAAGTEQMLGLFTAIQGRTNDANQTFRIMGELMNDLTSNDLLAGRMGQGRVQQIIQEVVANGGNVVDALGKIVEKLYGARMESPRVRAEMEAAFGRDVVNLLFATRDGLVDVEGATNRVRDSAGEMGLRLAQELASPAEPITKLKREFGEVLTSLGQVGLLLNEAFGSNNRSLLANTADELRRIKEAIGPIASGLSALAQGNLGEAWEKLSGSEAVKGFFQMPTWQRPAWLGGGKQAGGPVEAGRPVVVGEAGAEMFVPSQSGRIVPHALYGAALAAEYGLGVRGASTAMSGALRGHGGAARKHRPGDGRRDPRRGRSAGDEDRLRERPSAAHPIARHVGPRGSGRAGALAGRRAMASERQRRARRRRDARQHRRGRRKHRAAIQSGRATDRFEQLAAKAARARRRRRRGRGADHASELWRRRRPADALWRLRRLGRRSSLRRRRRDERRRRRVGKLAAAAAQAPERSSAAGATAAAGRRAKPAQAAARPLRRPISEGRSALENTIC